MVLTAILGDMPRDISTKEENFCRAFVKTRDGAFSYRQAYDVRDTTNAATINANAAKTLRRPAVQARIEQLISKAAEIAPVTLTVAQALSRWMEMAMADPDELIGTRVGCCRFCWGEAHGFQWREREYLDALGRAEKANEPLPDPAGGFGFYHAREPNPACPECCGEGVERIVARDTSKLSPSAKLLFGGVKKTNRGLEIIIADRVKCFENACRVIGAFDDKVRLNGALDLMAQSVTLQTSDPHEAERIYRDMIAGKVRANN